MNRSLKRILAVRFALTMVVALAAASAAIGWAASVVMQRQLDDALAAEALFSSAFLTQPLVAVPSHGVDQEEHAREINRYVALRGADGALLRAFPASAAGLPFDSAAFALGLGGGQGWHTASWHGAGVRSIYLHATSHDGEARVLQAAASMARISTVQRELMLALSAIVLLGGAVTMIGAWRLADTAVRPVAEITEQATQLQVGTLDHRIRAHATTEEYRGLVAVLNGMLERLDLAFRAQRRLTANVSHELRTPLTALRGEIEVALRKVRSPEDYERVLRSVLEEIEGMVELTEELLLVTRADANLVQAERTPVQVDTLVREAIDRLGHRLQSKGLHVELDLAAPSAPVDGVLFARLVEHVIENALTHSPPKGRIRVATESSAGALRLTVEDSGPGIAPEHLPHLFDPFYRADEARTRGDGFGLGLTVAAAVTRLHGGTITAANVPDGGARLEVHLPAPPAS